MPRIELSAGGAAFDCAGDDTLLRAALRAGLGFPYSCNTGSCGTCRFELEAGAVEHLRADPPAWSERDRKRGRWLGCQARPLADCRIRVRLDPAYAEAGPPARMTARLAAVTPISHDMSEFAFEVSGPDRFRPGQYALVTPPGVDAPRGYSMSNLPGEGLWRFVIKRTPGGAATGVLFDAMRPGDEVPIDGPYGIGWLREDAPRDLLLIAGGSGLSPMVSIARAAVASDRLQDRQIHFLYGCRAQRDACGEALIGGLAGFGERLRCTTAISEPEPGEAWSGPTGLVHDVAAQLFGERMGELEIYFAGPPAMTAAIQRLMHETGVPPERLHFDEFF